MLPVVTSPRWPCQPLPRLCPAAASLAPGSSCAPGTVLARCKCHLRAKLPASSWQTAWAESTVGWSGSPLGAVAV